MIVRDSQQKIRNHIKKYGKQTNFTITIRMIRYWWKVLNAAVFKNVLTMPEFEISEIDEALAECVGQLTDHKIIIHFNPTLIKTRETFILVLVHEMVHQWQLMYRTELPFEKRMSHGSTFSQWRYEIERIVGVILSTKVDIDDDDMLIT